MLLPSSSLNMCFCLQIIFLSRTPDYHVLLDSSIQIFQGYLKVNISNIPSLPIDYNATIVFMQAKNLGVIPYSFFHFIIGMINLIHAIPKSVLICPFSIPNATALVYILTISFLDYYNNFLVNLLDFFSYLLRSSSL